MAPLNFETNALYGENGTGKLYIATNWTWTTYPNGDGTNEDEAVTALSALTFVDVGYFEKFAPMIKKGDSKIITTDYCDVGEIRRTSEKIAGFKVDVQEILEMDNLARIIGSAVQHDTTAGIDYIGIKRMQTQDTYQVFKFVTCPKNGNSTTFYFVKAVLSSDVEFPITNLSKDDFVWTSLEFEVAEGWNFYIAKEV